MASPNQVEVIILSANGLNNPPAGATVSGPYAVVWVDPNNKCCTHVSNGDATSPYWNEKLVISLPGPVVGNTTLFIHIVRASGAKETGELIGSAQLKLWEFLDDVGIGQRVNRTLTLQRPSGRLQGKVYVKIAVLEPVYGSYPPPPGHGYHNPYDPYNAAAQAEAQASSKTSFLKRIATQLGVDVAVNALSEWLKGCWGGGGGGGGGGDYDDSSSLLQ